MKGGRDSGDVGLQLMSETFILVEGQFTLVIIATAGTGLVFNIHEM